MNEFPDQQPVLNLPAVNPEATSPQTPGEANPGIVHEATPTKETANNGASQSALAMPAMMFSDPTVPSAIPPSSTTVDPLISTTTSKTSDDDDLIPKEWILKAKAIIERTRDDPYSQNKALTQVKADYIKDRYNMIIKVDP